MADQTALLRAIGDYARMLSRGYDRGEVLYRLTDQALDVVGVDGAGVSIAEAEQLQFVTATDEQVTKVEETQIGASQGPCHDAYLSGDFVTTADLATEDRWPRFAPSARAQGFLAIAGIPMFAGDQPIGALNLYHRTRREWPADDLDVARVLADMTTGYIVNARTLSQQRQLTEQLQHGLDSRIVIEQAKGILAERHGMDPAAAFQAIRHHARNANAKVHDVARGVVEGTLQL